MQEQLGGLDGGVGVKVCAKHTVFQDIGNSHQDHALVMGHVIAHRHHDFPFGQARGGEVERVVPAIIAARAEFFQALEIAHRGFCIDHGGEPGGIRRHHGLGPQAALQSQAGYPKLEY